MVEILSVILIVATEKAACAGTFVACKELRALTKSKRGKHGDKKHTSETAESRGCYGEERHAAVTNSTADMIAPLPAIVDMADLDKTPAKKPRRGQAFAPQNTSFDENVDCVSDTTYERSTSNCTTTSDLTVSTAVCEELIRSTSTPPATLEGGDNVDWRCAFSTSDELWETSGTWGRHGACSDDDDVIELTFHKGVCVQEVKRGTSVVSYRVLARGERPDSYKPALDAADTPSPEATAQAAFCKPAGIQKPFIPFPSFFEDAMLD